MHRMPRLVIRLRRTIDHKPVLSIGKMRFSTSRPGKTNEYFITILVRRNYVGKINKLTTFGGDQLRNGASTWWWNITVLWLSSPTFFIFFRFVGQPTGRNFGPNFTLIGSKVVFWLIHVPFGGLVTSNILRGGLRSEKPPNFDPQNSANFLKKIALTLQPLSVNYP